MMRNVQNIHVETASQAFSLVVVSWLSSLGLGEVEYARTFTNALENTRKHCCFCAKLSVGGHFQPITWWAAQNLSYAQAQ